MSGFLSPALLSQIQGISEGEMPDTFTVDVPSGTFTPDGQGGGGYGAPTTRGPYACRFGRTNAEEVTVADRDESDPDEVVSFPLAVALADNEVGTGTQTRTATVFRFEVEAVLPLGSFAVNRRARIRRLG